MSTLGTGRLIGRLPFACSAPHSERVTIRGHLAPVQQSQSHLGIQHFGRKTTWVVPVIKYTYLNGANQANIEMGFFKTCQTKTFRIITINDKVDYKSRAFRTFDQVINLRCG